MSLAVVNIHGEKDFETELKGVVGGKGGVKVYVVDGSGVEVVNTAEKEEVGIKETEWDGKGAFVFKKHSLTLLRWEV